jgi:CRISPR-associated endonuclease Cas2
MSRVAQPAWHWLICYDISLPRRRRRVAACLEAHGTRLQRSIFVVEATTAQAKALLRRCRAMIATADKVDLYLLRQRGSVVLAGAPLPAPQTYWIC